MYAYGAYGGVNEVEFDANLFSLLDRGWVYAFAHIRGDADMVIIDTPPMLTVSDPLIIASNVDGVVLVCRTGRTALDALSKAAATLRGAEKLVGVVVNSQSKKMRTYTSANMPAQAFAPAPARENALVP